jgi:hypothetical protein
MSSVAGVSCAADQTHEKGSSRSRYLEPPYYSALASDGEDRRQRITGAGNIHTRCFEAVDATATSTWHLLLEDLTDSHFIATEWPLPPTLEQCESIVGPRRSSIPRGWWGSYRHKRSRLIASPRRKREINTGRCRTINGSSGELS